MMKDPFLIWNEIALEANRVSHTDGSGEQTGPTLSSRALAIVHIAMYDAYAGVKHNPTNWPFYIPPTMSAPPDSEDARLAAVAGAAFTALTRLFPSQKKYFDIQLQLHGTTTHPGHKFGVHTAENILEDRENDPSASRGYYQATPGRGHHQVDPDNPSQGFHGPRYGRDSKGFAITNRHVLRAPPLDNPVYTKALKEVRAKGCKPELMGTLPANMQSRKRNPEETLIGVYWGYDGAAGLGTPPRLYNQIIRKIAVAKGNTPDQNARLLTLVNVAMGDAGILAWDQKYEHDFWRPVVGVREHDKSCGVRTAGQPMPASQSISGDSDPSWLPLGAPKSNAATTVMTALATFPFANVQSARVKNFTPNFPAYPSGHATFGAAAFHITRLFYGVARGNRSEDSLLQGLKNPDGTPIFFESEEMNNITQDNEGAVRPLHRRSFAGGLWDMILENGLSRVYLGVHWHFDAFAYTSSGKPDLNQTMVGGVPLGLTIAEDIFRAGRGKGPVKSTVPPRPGVAVTPARSFATKRKGRGRSR